MSADQRRRRHRVRSGIARSSESPPHASPSPSPVRHEQPPLSPGPLPPPPAPPLPEPLLLPELLLEPVPLLEPVELAPLELLDVAFGWQMRLVMP